MVALDKFYYIVAKHSDKALDVKGGSTKDGAPIQQWDSTSGKHQKQFMFVPNDEGFYYIVARHSGKGLDVQGVSLHEGAPLQQWNARSGKPNKQFRLVPAGDGSYYIVARHSGKALDVRDRSKANGAVIQQWDYESAQANKRFFLKEADTFNLPSVKQSYPASNEIGDVARMTQFQAPPDTTNEVLLGEVLVPFLLVSDGPLEAQVRDTPYYKLSRFGCWKKALYYEHDGRTEYEHQVQTKRGLTMTTSQSIEKTVGLTMGADAGLKIIADITLGLKMGLTAGLKVTESSSRTVMREELVNVKRTFPVGVRLAQCVWFRADRYVLTRTDGTMVLQWEVINDKEFVSDVYPDLPI